MIDSLTLMPSLRTASAMTNGIDVKPVACAWLAVDALEEAWVKAQNIDCTSTCERDGGGDTDSYSGSTLIDKPVTLIGCSPPLTGGGVSLGK